jgi:hypothetical protein
MELSWSLMAYVNTKFHANLSVDWKVEKKVDHKSELFFKPLHVMTQFDQPDIFVLKLPELNRLAQWQSRSM